ncbi:MAG TPA: hypothetical protein VFQ45_11130, partial [Longimicrobium sp.]|nr:hypothetical protein [Longimicrobium sp.]
DRAARTAHPAWMRLPAARAAEPVRVLMIPRAWTIARGHFAGQTVPVSMDLAFASPPGEASAYYYPRGAVSWDHARLPVPVAFGHAATHEPITPADSLHFWAAAEAAMQADGVRWFTPAPEGMPGLHRVMVRIDHSIGASARGGSHPDGNGHLENGTVLFLNPTVMRSPNVVQHELRHVLGVGHTCSWRSVMAAFTCPSRMLEYEPTEWDVAYLHLLHLTHRLQVELSAPYNLREALAGERRLVLGN